MCGLGGRAAQRLPFGVELAQEEVTALLLVGLPDGARGQLAARGGTAGSLGWARGASARSPSRASRRPAARRGRGGSPPGRRRSARWGRSASSARSAQAWRQRGSRAATAATASRRRSGGRDRAASRAAASSGASGSRTVSGLPEVNWTAVLGGHRAML